MNKSFIDDLPEFTRNKVLFYLTPNELAQFSKCCKIFRHYANQDSFWLVGS
jgi:hypothetical protein